jgi:hypothetical protein
MQLLHDVLDNILISNADYQQLITCRCVGTGIAE